MSLIKRILNCSKLPPNQSNSAYAWLSMLVFFVWKYAAGGGTPIEIVLAVLTLVVFFVLYFAHFWTGNKVSICIVLTIFSLGLLWAPLNAGASVFVVFSAACCSSIKPNKIAYLCVVLIVFGAAFEASIFNLPSDFWVPGIVISSVIGVATIMQTSLRQSQLKLVRSQEEVAYLATIAERERISRDLHDLLGHTLSLITIKAELAGKLTGRDIQAAQREIADIEKTARNALSEVRAAVTGYREVGFTHELANAASCLGAADIHLSTEIEGIKLSAAAENILSLALREAVTNVARHSQAGRCSIKLALAGNWIELLIHDNGVQLHDGQEVKLGNGLNGMRERVAGIGGQLNWEVKQGLLLQIRLPKDNNMLQGAST